MSTHELTDPAQEGQTDGTAVSSAFPCASVRQALDAAMDPIIIHRPDGTLVYWNHIAARLAGFESTEVEGAQPWVWSAAPPRVREERLHQLRLQGSLRFTCEHCTPAPTRRWVEISCAWVETEIGPLIVAVERDVSERTHAEKALRDMAFRDPLTGLANRAMLEDRLKLAVANAERHRDILGVLFIDLDDFKPINDTHGHAAGDAVLKTAAARMLGAVRLEDTVARVGGDEFVIVLPRLREPGGLVRAANKIRSVISEPFTLGDEVFCCVTATVGHALFDPEHDDAHTLLIRADLAMYYARQAGIHIAGAEPLE